MARHDNQQQQTATTATAAASVTTDEEQLHTSEATEDEPSSPTTTLGRRRREGSDEDEVDDQSRERRARREQEWLERRQRREEEERRIERSITARQAEEIEQFLRQPEISARLANMQDNGIIPDEEEVRVETMSRRYNEFMQEQQTSDQHPLLIQQRCHEYRVDNRMDQRLADFGLIALARMARQIWSHNVLEVMQDLDSIERRNVANAPAITAEDITIREATEHEAAEHVHRLIRTQPGDDMVLSGETLRLRDQLIGTLPRLQETLGRQLAEWEPRVQRQVNDLFNEHEEQEEESEQE
ncbi:hypothetical protein BDB00DRAFT_800409 [Zychaea mexicana]|uniref:uncharacterized protein n=1 Tax=Zychaea mexicana TaxID=64656 RepID=UPI0022FF2938|nr:uncharacterized protein BDB00DRAFT_800409 [Zychaea mexicana]KAI9498469.1 hypothetical protein BDB00DRAFT_800409 [Zychaea mexicana]